jgi:hypothetical protein
VTTPCGHTFCRACFARTTDHSNKCPMCRTVGTLHMKHLVFSKCRECPSCTRKVKHIHQQSMDRRGCRGVHLRIRRILGWWIALSGLCGWVRYGVGLSPVACSRGAASWRGLPVEVIKHLRWGCLFRWCMWGGSCQLV